ncbi:uncharacterized protein LOC114517692 isoform X2 [Dendronephthya gigantea]|uniref:uncharacterized protein LOC114517692 isoform X2 n=1 Tax=Dendronephthya gigantea TaxID=151771 RepID=UPI0010695A11|nr:uncharacterized protein LOC114517692 isoform X2 [Dendronephthya gigantea]
MLFRNLASSQLMQLNYNANYGLTKVKLTQDDEDKDGESQQSGKQSFFFVFCETCKKLTQGKLRCPCSNCKEGSFVLSQVRQKQLNIDQLHYQLTTENRRANEKMNALMQQNSDLKLQVTQARHQADEFYKTGLERNIDAVSLYRKPVVSIKIGSRQSRKTFKYVQSRKSVYKRPSKRMVNNCVTPWH